ncbi:hypothetical protein TTHERM_000962138 (macronuclear) [Tetrahymena thermophila SB210]|uniref:Transmembrane protein n=1 Tax=Tetrahymena thermophila (strain SB210) TaxID=312017 RepID=W7X2E4_TETTS|nr:hypothetical protein TTHERM_000962138 [Tetrahymena thermophila SB210]EWS73390.1 hypothetical protein TTHERM_000962138 [Tetrahymena thermophila SB210]|eukprot:XP_012654080.1 hypothetical protein TTHERM_000962138 [Tetrahymena thermophila SB210]
MVRIQYIYLQFSVAILLLQSKIFNAFSTEANYCYAKKLSISSNDKQVRSSMSSLIRYLSQHLQKFLKNQLTRCSNIVICQKRSIRKRFYFRNRSKFMPFVKHNFSQHKHLSIYLHLTLQNVGIVCP